jgi:phosphatidylinositol dimannoside acyltransferase
MIVRESIIRDFARLVIWYPVRLIIGCLPVTVSFALFRLLGGLHVRICAGSVKKLGNNIHRGHPHITDQTAAAIIRTYLENHYIDRLHIFTYPRLRHSSEMGKICSVEAAERIDSVLKKGKGAIIVLGHYGPIQLPLFQLGASGYRIIQVGLPTGEGLSWVGRHVAFRLRLRYEKMIPAEILPADTFLRPLFNHLKSNGIVMMNLDPAGGGRWIGRLMWKQFFGYRIPFSLGSAILSHKTGAPILPLSIDRTGRTRYLFTIHEPVWPEESRSPEILLERMVDWYEQMVSKDPGLWHFWDEFEEGKLIRNSA